MAGPRATVYFHIGAPKTGTTYLQGILDENRSALRRAGLLYPGNQQAHFWASQDLRDTKFHRHMDAHVPGSWDRLVKEISRWPGRALIDHESFAAATRAAIDQALTDLAFADVHLVFTARDLARQLPAAWQERIKNGSTGGYHDFLACVRAEPDDRPGWARRFWAMQGAPTVLARWARGLPAERVHVVTVPPAGSDPGLLWRRFAGLLGLQPEAYDRAPREANSSLGAAEAAVLRRLNAAIADADVPWPAYASVFKQRLAPALADRGGAGIALPEEYFDWAVDWSRQAVDQLREAGYDVVGDLAELIPAVRPAGLDPDAAPSDAQADAAVAGMVSLVSTAVTGRVARTAVRRSQRGALARRMEDAAARTRPLAAVRDAYRRRFG